MCMQRVALDALTKAKAVSQLLLISAAGCGDSRMIFTIVGVSIGTQSFKALVKAFEDINAVSLLNMTYYLGCFLLMSY